MSHLALLLLVAAADPPADPLRDLAEQPRRYIGVRVTVAVRLTGEVSPAADGYSELLVTADGVSLDRLKFRAAESLAVQVPDTGATHEEPLPARLVGRVLGADAAGRGRYVVHVDEVQLLDANGQVADTLTPKAAPAKAEPPPESVTVVEPPPAAVATPEPPAAAAEEPSASGLPVLPIAAGGGVGLLLAVAGGVAVAVRRRKPAAQVMPTASAVSFAAAPEPGEIGPLTVGDRLNRRAR